MASPAAQGRALRLGLPAALAALLAWLVLWHIPREMIFRPLQPVTRTPAAVGLDYRDFSLRPADATLQLAGWWMPAGNPRALLLFIHGGGSNRDSGFFHSLDFYRALVARRIGVAAIDLRNHGNSGGDGRGLQFGRSEKADVLAAVAWLRARSPGLPLYLMGISMGGSAVIQAAGAGAPVEGLILLDPALDSISVLSHGAAAETGLPAPLFRPSAWVAVETLGVPGGEAQAAALLHRLALPVLLIQDPGDPVALAALARKSAGANPHILYRELPAASAADMQRLAWKRGWGSHVAAFALQPELVLADITGFIDAAGARREVPAQR